MISILKPGIGHKIISESNIIATGDKLTVTFEDHYSVYDDVTKDLNV